MTRIRRNLLRADINHQHRLGQERAAFRRVLRSIRAWFAPLWHVARYLLAYTACALPVLALGAVLWGGR